MDVGVKYNLCMRQSILNNTSLNAIKTSFTVVKICFGRFVLLSSCVIFCSELFAACVDACARSHAQLCLV